MSGVVVRSSLQWAAGGWLFFIGENVLLSENRTYLIRQLGDDGYHYLYGTISTAAMASIGYAYLKKIRSMPLVPPTIGSMAASFAALSLGLVMASQALPKLQIPMHYADSEQKYAPERQAPEQQPKREWKVRCPFDFTDSHGSDISGLDRITRHPGLWAFGFVGLGQALLLPTLPQRVWWSMPILVAWVGGAHTDSRHRRGMGGTLTPEQDAVTSNVPFWAMLTGKQSLVASEIKPLNAVLATGVAAVWMLQRGRGGGAMVKNAVRVAPR